MTELQQQRVCHVMMGQGRSLPSPPAGAGHVPTPISPVGDDKEPSPIISWGIALVSWNCSFPMGGKEGALPPPPGRCPGHCGVYKRAWGSTGQHPAPCTRLSSLILVVSPSLPSLPPQLLLSPGVSGFPRESLSPELQQLCQGRPGVVGLGALDWSSLGASWMWIFSIAMG